MVKIETARRIRGQRSPSGKKEVEGDFGRPDQRNWKDQGLDGGMVSATD